MSSPAVSVVIPAYNEAMFVRRAVDSVLNQTLTDLELIAVDDGSVDNTLAVLQSCEPPVRSLTQPNAGPAAARNRGLRTARGEFVAFLDADDWWQPTKLERQVALLRTRPDLGFCSTATRVVLADGSPAGNCRCALASDAPGSARD